MLIIPLTGKISKRNPPIITIAIILINCFVFFVLQAGDTEQYEHAIEFYFDSGLAKIEIPRYLDYLDTVETGEQTPGLKKPKDFNRDSIGPIYFKMQSDDVFIKKLQNHEIITPNEQIYNEWKRLRTNYQDLLSGVVSVRYGFRPAHKNFVTSITYMFLHGSFMHLLGNMVFLWLVGCVLELGCGRVFYVSLYLFSGICSVALFTLAYMNSAVPLIGASGAISGLMGAFTVMYGRTKIKVFYSLGFYFNYAKVYAIILLPIWIGNEVFQLFFGGYTQIAYVAHLGGLISGAALGFLNLKFFRRVDEKIFEEDPKAMIPALLEEALERIAKLDMDEARPLLEQVLELDPNNPDALKHLFNIDRLNPQSERFHESASILLKHLSSVNNAHEELYETYQEYFRVSQRPRLNRDLSFRIASVFCENGYLKEAEGIFAAFLNKFPGFQKNPTGILNLARAYLKKGASGKGAKCLRIICKKYPESAESQIAHRLLKGHAS